jgi:hypothetical protein
LPARITHAGRPVADNPKGQAFPAWDGDADERRNTIGVNSPHALQDFVLDHVRDHGPITQYALWRAVLAAGFNDPHEAKLSATLIVLRRAGELKSERDGLARKSPRKPPFFSPMWESA